jgi:putative CGCGG family rSAM target protein
MFGAHAFTGWHLVTAEMSASSADDHGHGEAEPVSDDVHENSWSANLEQPEHAEDRDRLIQEALDAVEHTASGYHVNLVTHGAHGHPEGYLFEALAEAYDQSDVTWEYIEQCGCGGHVTRVYVP